MYLVGHYSFAIAGPAEDDTTVVFSARDRFRDRPYVVRVVDGFLRVSPEIIDLMTQAPDQIDEYRLQLKPGVVRSDGYSQKAAFLALPVRL